MKLRESGMPEESYWETLLDVKLILERLEIDNRLRDVVELGCGYGTFTIPVARRVSGTLRTFDIDAGMVEKTIRRTVAEKVRNIICEQRDIFSHGFGIMPESQDACLLFNILHCEEPLRLLCEAARVVRPVSFVFAIHWRCDPATPRGPSMEIRPRPEQIIELAKEAGLLASPDPDLALLDLPPWHCGIRFQRSCMHS